MSRVEVCESSLQRRGIRTGEYLGRGNDGTGSGGRHGRRFSIGSAGVIV